MGRTFRTPLHPLESDIMDMDANIAAETENLRQTALRLERAGLHIDRSALSPAHRRAFFALQCRIAADPAPPEPQRPPIGFPYPNAR